MAKIVWHHGAGSVGSESHCARGDHDWTSPPPSTCTLGWLLSQPRWWRGGGLLHAVTALPLLHALLPLIFFFFNEDPRLSPCNRGWDKGGELQVPSPGWHEVPLPRLVLWHRSRLGHMQRPPRFLPPYTSPDLVGGAVWRVRSGA